MDHLRKTISIWREYYQSSNPEFDTSNPARATEKKDGKRVQGGDVWQRGYIMECLLNFPLDESENEGEASSSEHIKEHLGEDEVREQLISLYTYLLRLISNNPRLLTEGNEGFKPNNIHHSVHMDIILAAMKIAFQIRFPGKQLVEDAIDEETEEAESSR